MRRPSIFKRRPFARDVDTSLTYPPPIEGIAPRRQKRNAKMKINPVVSNVEEITFGVEIETTIPAGLIRVGHYHNGLPVVLNPGLSGLPAPTFQGMSWKAERDCSIQVTDSQHAACEFVSPILKGEAGLTHLLEFVRRLGGKRAQV